MKKYKERGGLFWTLSSFCFCFLIVSITAGLHERSLNLFVFAFLCAIAGKLERISNGLSDMSNQDDAL